MSIVSLVIAPTLAIRFHTSTSDAAKSTQQIEMKITADNKTKSDVSISINGNDSKDDLKKLVDALKADKMDEHGNLSVEFKNGSLTVNGKSQPADVVKKYSQYLEGKKDFNFSINIEEK